MSDAERWGALIGLEGVLDDGPPTLSLFDYSCWHHGSPLICRAVCRDSHMSPDAFARDRGVHVLEVFVTFHLSSWSFGIAVPLRYNLAEAEKGLRVLLCTLYSSFGRIMGGFYSFPRS